MTLMRIVLWLVTAAFGAYTLWVLAQIGYFGIWRAGFADIGSTQVTLDLIISSALLVGFVVRDARAKGLPWWPWALVTLVGGSFGTLGYLLWPARRREAAAGAAAG